MKAEHSRQIPQIPTGNLEPSIVLKITIVHLKYYYPNLVHSYAVKILLYLIIII